jgi:murein DD-endopeptidase MepM/ murein hydrolase activator NlpD
VLAVADGVVTHAGRVAGRGTVTVQHAGGLSSTYEPVDPGVLVGQRVSVGDVVGALAPGDGEALAGHCGPLDCLHLGARRDAGYVDPLVLLLGGRVRLLPLGGQPTTG